MKHTFPKFTLMLSLFLVALSFIVFVFLYRQVEANSQAALDTWTKWKIEDARRNNLKSIEDSLVETAQARTLLDGHFALSSDVVPFLDMVEGVGRQVGATITVTGVDIAKDGVGLIVRGTATGGFESIYKFLRLLENSPYELEFNSFEVQNVAVSQWNASFELRLLTFIK